MIRSDALKSCKAAIIGLGALGSRSAEKMCRSGIGELILIDRDFVEVHNLATQLLYTKTDVGKAKAEALANHLKRRFPHVRLKSIVADIDNRNVSLLKADIILDCTDNMETRFLINEFCRRENIRWIHSGALAAKGTVMPIMPGKPCFRCVFREVAGLAGCDTAGILPAAAQATASLQVEYAVRILHGTKVEQQLVRLDVKTGRIVLKVKRNPSCPACKGKWAYLTGKKISRPVKLCGSGVYQFRGRKLDLKKLHGRFGGKLSEYCMHTDSFTAFKDGRVIVKAHSGIRARSIFLEI